MTHITINRLTKEDVQQQREKHRSTLHRLGYNPDEMLRWQKENCRCCVNSQFSLWHDEEALRAWEQLRTLAPPLAARYRITKANAPTSTGKIWQVWDGPRRISVHKTWQEAINHATSTMPD